MLLLKDPQEGRPRRRAAPARYLIPRPSPADLARVAAAGWKDQTPIEVYALLARRVRLVRRLRRVCLTLAVLLIFHLGLVCCLLLALKGRS